MIIECPHCRTKFSIDDTLVARSKSPKFHCSRCDNYFVQPDQPTFEPLPATTTNDFSTLDFESGSETTEIDDDLDQENFLDEEYAAPELSPLESLPSFDIPTQFSTTSAPPTGRSNAGLISSAALLALYPLCLTLLFFLVSQGLNNLPDSISDRLLVSGKRVPLLPPFGLESRDIKGGVQVLEDGSKVFDLRGDVHNTLPVQYRGLLIEGKLFDETNQLIARIVAPINLDIIGAKINSLSKHAIDEILSKQPADNGEIAAEKVRPFRLIFTGLKNPEKVRYVGARVYSVEK
jgi:predicted Zn finger-like uncharacterized protein